MTSAQVHVSFPSERVALIELDAPPNNFGSWALLEVLHHRIIASRDAGAAVLVLDSAVEGVFMAHAYLPDLLALSQDEPRTGADGYWFRVVRELDEGPMLSIAANRGRAWGGGAELSWACNLRIAGRAATYAQPEVALGLIPGAGGVGRVVRLVGESVAWQLLLDGEPMTAGRAHEVGLVHRVVPDERLREEAVSWALELAERPAAALRAVKRALVGGRDRSLLEALKHDASVFYEVLSTDLARKLLSRAMTRYEAGESPDDVLGMQGRG